MTQSPFQRCFNEQTVQLSHCLTNLFYLMFLLWFTFLIIRHALSNAVIIPYCNHTDYSIGVCIWLQVKNTPLFITPLGHLLNHSWFYNSYRTILISHKQALCVIHSVFLFWHFFSAVIKKPIFRPSNVLIGTGNLSHWLDPFSSW